MKFEKIFGMDDKAYSSKRHFFKTYDLIRKEFNDSVNDFLDNQAMHISVVSIEDNNKKSITIGKENSFYIKAKCQGFLYKEELKILLKNPYFVSIESVYVMNNSGTKKYEKTLFLDSILYHIDKILSIGNDNYFYLLFNESASLSYN